MHVPLNLFDKNVLTVLSFCNFCSTCSKIMQPNANIGTEWAKVLFNVYTWSPGNLLPLTGKVLRMS